MSTDVAHKSWWQIFEVVFGIPCLVAMALQLVAPLSLPRGFLSPVMVLGGAVLIVVGITLVVLARRELAQQGNPPTQGFPQARSLAQVSSLSQGIPSTSGAFAFWRGSLWHSISPGC